MVRRMYCMGVGEMSKYNFEQQRSDYETPPELYKMALNLVGAEEFDIDVCCSRANIPAKFHYIDGFADGLKRDWDKLNWCNPPYKFAPKWVKKAFVEQQKGNSTIMLIPARTETKYWHNYILDEKGSCNRKNVKVKFLRKGYQFINPDSNQTCGVFKNALALVYFVGKR